MKRKIIRQLMTVILALVCMLQAMGCGASSGQAVREDIREKLLLAYQYLENMEYDSALDAFAAVIEIDEKIPEAYIGMARAYSAKGDQGAARETAAKGKEVTEAPYFEDLERMYGKVQDNEDTLKEIAELLREGEEKIPGELEESKSGLLSETLDRLWEELDALDIYEVIGSDILVYPVDPEKGIYLILYPEGHFYLGEVHFSSYSELLAQAAEETAEGAEAAAEGEEEGNALPAMSYEELVIPILEGHGIMAGFNNMPELSDLYIGGWKDSEPEGEEGIHVYQYLQGGARYVYHGAFSASSYTDPKAVYGSTKAFLEAMSGTGASVEELYGELPLTNIYFYHNDQTRHIKGQYSSDFENRELVELIEQGREKDLIKRLRQETSEFPIDGDLLSVGRGLKCEQCDVDHGLYVLGAEPNGKVEHYYKKYIVDRQGHLLAKTYDQMVWFTDSGISCLLVKEEGTDKDYYVYENLFFSPEKPGGDIWQADFDWNGTETGRTLLGTAKTMEDAARYVHAGGVGGGSLEPLLQAEKTDEGIRIRDLDGNECGTIKVDDPFDWSVTITGKMVQVKNPASDANRIFIVWND